MATAEFAIEWWLWPNVLSLDAPIISILWQHCFAHDAHVSLSLAAQCALPLAVWLIYLVDRLLDTRNGLPALTPRHQFFCTHRRFCFALALSAAAALFVAICFLPQRILLAGFLFSGCMVFYFFQVHASRRIFISKELLVGFLFSLGTAIAPLARSARPERLIPFVLLLALLCWLNTAAIEIREAGQADSASAWAADHMLLLALLVCCASGALLYSNLYHSALALLISAFAFMGLSDTAGTSISSRALRVWLDVPLLSPLLLLGWR